jgi:hypothetical protein
MAKIKKAQTGKKVDLNTAQQKNQLDNVYNKIYQGAKRDSIKESNRTLPSTYEQMRRKAGGKNISSTALRAEQDKRNKKEVANSKTSRTINLGQGEKKVIKPYLSKLDAKGRTENAMIDRAINAQRRNGGPVKKKMRNGGSLSGLKASNKRDKGTDVGGAWTKVQNKTLKGAKGKASLTKDKQLGATKMTAKSGTKMSKK